MKILFALLVFSFLTVKNVHAYLDPGSGSYMLQLLIGMFLGGAYFFRNFFKGLKDKITDFFKNHSKKK